MDFTNSKKQGDWGMGQAIAWFTLKGYTVALPITDSQCYDLIIDTGHGLERVEVKTTTYRKPATTRRPKPPFFVNLRTCGGNRSGVGKTRMISSKHVDWVFVAVPGANYLIPASVAEGKTVIGLYKTFDKYLLGGVPAAGL